MSGRKRGRAEHEAEDEAVEPIPVELDDDESDGGEEEGLIEVDFDFRAPDDQDDDLAIKRALAHYLSKSPFAAGEMAEAICRQKHVGSVVKANEQPIAFLSVLNMHREDLLCMTQVKEFALSKARGSEHTRLAALFADTAAPLGLLLNYRVANAPPHLAPFLQRALFKEIAAASIADPAYAFANYLILTRTYTERDEGTAGDIPEDAPRAKRRKGGEEARKAFYFEEELYADHADMVVNFEVADDAAAGKLTFEAIIDVMGQLLVVPAAAIPVVLDELEPYLDESLMSQVQDW